ncbi:calcium-binding protein [Roseomonas sp. 18066]|uniref:calcium-binding protein n=1 Tax=Roseomonas sp. 18066 TaxID=2681412 RepID=UPI0013590C46|nr:calcium-binding protein [Roseomonas sp. 18066]
MARYDGTLKNDSFLFSSHREADIIYADGLASPRDGIGGSNTIMAGTGSDTLFGGYGRDVIYGGNGDDYITGYGVAGPTPSAANVFASEDQADRLFGGRGRDTILGGGGDDYIDGGSNHDLLYGGSGNDTIKGGSGNDVIHSGEGADQLWGGSGADTFVYAYNPSLSEMAYDANGGFDTIHDFQVGVDKIDLRPLYIRAADVTLVDTAAGLELHFFAVYEDTEIHLKGVHALQAGDILFAA